MSVVACVLKRSVKSFQKACKSYNLCFPTICNRQFLFSSTIRLTGRMCNQHGSKFKSSWKHFLKNENTLLVHAKIYNKIHCIKSVRIQSYSVRMRGNADQNNNRYGDFSRSDKYYHRIYHCIYHCNTIRANKNLSERNYALSNLTR